MSGGHFDYNQYKIGDIADEVENIIQTQENPTDNDGYPPEIQEKFKEGLYFLRKAEIYAQRMDWFISGDDGEESFLSRLKEQLDQLDKKFFPPKE